MNKSIILNRINLIGFIWTLNVIIVNLGFLVIVDNPILLIVDGLVVTWTIHSSNSSVKT